MAKAFWIDKAIKSPGALRAKLGVSGDKTIPKSKLAVKKGDSAKTKRQKNLAKTLRSFHHA